MDVILDPIHPRLLFLSSTTPLSMVCIDTFAKKSGQPWVFLRICLYHTISMIGLWPTSSLCYVNLPLKVRKWRNHRIHPLACHSQSLFFFVYRCSDQKLQHFLSYMMNEILIDSTMLLGYTAILDYKSLSKWWGIILIFMLFLLISFSFIKFKRWIRWLKGLSGKNWWICDDR